MKSGENGILSQPVSETGRIMRFELPTADPEQPKGRSDAPREAAQAGLLPADRLVSISCVP